MGISEDEVVKRVMLGRTVDGVFTTVDDVAQTALVPSGLPQCRTHGPIVYSQPRLAYAVGN